MDLDIKLKIELNVDGKVKWYEKVCIYFIKNTKCKCDPVQEFIKMC